MIVRVSILCGFVSRVRLWGCGLCSRLGLGSRFLFSGFGLVFIFIVNLHAFFVSIGWFCVGGLLSIRVYVGDLGFIGVDGFFVISIVLFFVWILSNMLFLFCIGVIGVDGRDFVIIRLWFWD